MSGKKIVTVEGLPEREKEAYAWAFAEAGAVQCGFCIPGMIISAKALLDKNPNPAPLEIKEAIRGNICRCTGYVKIEEAIGLAAEVLRGEKGKSKRRRLRALEAVLAAGRCPGEGVGDSPVCG